MSSIVAYVMIITDGNTKMISLPKKDMSRYNVNATLLVQRPKTKTLENNE